MGKYTEHAAAVYLKADVAVTQLEDAISLFISGRYLSAITLAGAADAIFCGVIEANGGQVPADRTWAEIEAVRQKGILLADNITRKEAFKTWNFTRNRLKHHDVGRDCNSLEVFEIDEAYEWIERARNSGKELGLEPKNCDEFESYVVPWFFLSG
ncbi:hypothetical protein [Rhizobium sp. L1K21]|uniref:hypothetical protein n=1 Tax=Rhizobium sp. L1K21 TaxID=2954933 RepID=UPI002092FFC2|nr:hypothetical protein [Rhizobium sp. L1K21]MCO6185220.1 hypothetical protein [Rhizobium sp. L1K21]